MRIQDITMREAPSAYIFESDGMVRRQRQLEGDEETQAGGVEGEEREAVTA